MLAGEMGLQKSYSIGISPGKSSPAARRQGWGTGTSREQLQQGGAWVGSGEASQGREPNWCPQDNGNENNLS